ncbi:MAG: AmmeMemoRadiSam system protein B [Candidatus Eiseniibacteriota bacterium]|jgi:hypothetical protein
MQGRRRIPRGRRPAPGAVTGAFLVLGLLATVPGAAPRATGAELRPAAVAGRFYPADAGRLSRAIDGFMDAARPARTERPIAIVAPHAGYIYSGQIAADAYRQAADHDYDLVVILGTNHTTAGFTRISVYDGPGYLTPLGVAAIDTSITHRLLGAGRGAGSAAGPDWIFEPAVHRREHSVEVQVPFVQRLFPGVPIVAAVIGDRDPERCARAGEELAAVIGARRALLVASTDLAHYPAHAGAVRADHAMLAAMTTLEPAHLHRVAVDELARGTPALSTCACGEGPVMVAMAAARSLGATRGVVISHATSGQAAVGERARVVGYGAVVFCAGVPGADTSVIDKRVEVPAGADGGAPETPGREAPGVGESTGEPAAGQLAAGERATLLRIARRTIARYLDAGVTPLVRDLPPALARHRGAFVTLREHGRLRGCIGHMAEDLPLGQVVGAMALEAAFSDQRFPPLAAEELDRITIEVSVLTPHRPVAGPEAIVVGRDGVVLRKNGRSAVYLPHVATEQGWDRDTMLDHLSQKAGLPRDAWRRGAEFLTFQAEVFGE